MTILTPYFFFLYMYYTLRPKIRTILGLMSPRKDTFQPTTKAKSPSGMSSLFLFLILTKADDLSSFEKTN